MYMFMLINLKIKTKWIIYLGKYRRSKLTDACVENVNRAVVPGWGHVSSHSFATDRVPGLSRVFYKKKLPKSFYDPN